MAAPSSWLDAEVATRRAAKTVMDGHRCDGERLITRRTAGSSGCAEAPRRARFLHAGRQMPVGRFSGRTRRGQLPTVNALGAQLHRRPDYQDGHDLREPPYAVMRTRIDAAPVRLGG
jgi:hypothetical protein